MTEANTGPEPYGLDPLDPEASEGDKDARTWATFCHLAGLAAFMPIMLGFGGVIGPLILWLIKRERYPFVEEQGKEAINFQITMLIYGVIAGVLWFACIGVVLVPVVILADIICIIVAAIKTNDGHHYRYPRLLIIRFLK